MAKTKLNSNQLANNTDIFSAKNLHQGSGILINQLPQPVVDNNTVALYHLNDSTENDIENGPVYNWGALEYINGQNGFGKAARVVDTNTESILGTSLFQDTYTIGTGDYTLDFWLKVEGLGDDTYVSDVGFGSDYGNDFQNITLQNYFGEYTIQCGTQYSVYWWGYVDTTKWYHIAIERYNQTKYLYVDGQMKCQFYNNDDINGSYPFLTYFDTDAGTDVEKYVYVDEVRFSNIARWHGENFTPYTQPYSRIDLPREYQLVADTANVLATKQEVWNREPTLQLGTGLVKNQNTGVLSVDNTVITTNNAKSKGLWTTTTLSEGTNILFTDEIGLVPVSNTVALAPLTEEDGLQVFTTTNAELNEITSNITFPDNDYAYVTPYNFPRDYETGLVSSYDIGTGDFTIETWIKIPDDTPTAVALSIRDYNWFEIQIGLSSTNCYLWGNVGETISGDSITVEPNVYHHLALVRHNGTTQGYCDGQLLEFNLPDAFSTVEFDSNYGKVDVNTPCYIHHFRISDVARYIEAFTPSYENFFTNGPTGNKEVSFDPTSISGYSASSTQVLKNNSGTLAWDGSSQTPSIAYYSGLTTTTVDTSSDFDSEDLTTKGLVKVYKNGILCRPNNGANLYDYSLSGTTVVFNNALISTDTVAVEVYYV